MARKYSKAASEKVERTMHAHKQATLKSASGKGERQEAGDCNRTFRSTQGGQKGAGKKEGGDVQMTTRTPKPVSPQQIPTKQVSTGSGTKCATAHIASSGNITPPKADKRCAHLSSHRPGRTALDAAEKCGIQSRQPNAQFRERTICVRLVPP